MIKNGAAIIIIAFGRLFFHCQKCSAQYINAVRLLAAIPYPITLKMLKPILTVQTDCANEAQRINIFFAIENNYYQRRKINAKHFQSIFIQTMKRIIYEWGQTHRAPSTKFRVENFFTFSQKERRKRLSQKARNNKTQTEQ